MQGRKQKKNRIVLTLLAACMLLCGCGEVVPETEEVVEAMPTLGLTPSFNYSVEKQMPSVMVDPMGYLPASNKKAYIYGEILPDTFEVVEAESKDVVLTGDIREKATVEDEVVGVVDFTDLRTPGTYYIKCDHVGYSYAFPISETAYETEMDSLCEEIYAALETADLDTALNTAYPLMLSYELYPTYFLQSSGNNQTASKIPTVVQKLKPIAEKAKTLESLDGICFLTQYANISKQFDAGYASECQRISMQIWNSMAKNPQVTQWELLQAATALYRCTGNVVYRNYMLTHDAEYGQIDVTTKQGFYTALSYLQTTQKVEFETCNVLIKALMKDSEELAQETKADPFQSRAELGRKPLSGSLWNGLRLSVVDYIITNHEYIMLLEDHIHFLYGRNKDAASLRQNMTLEEKAETLLLLNAITAEKEMLVSN